MSLFGLCFRRFAFASDGIKILFIDQSCTSRVVDLVVLVVIVLVAFSDIRICFDLPGARFVEGVSYREVAIHIVLGLGVLVVVVADARFHGHAVFEQVGTASHAIFGGTGLRCLVVGDAERAVLVGKQVT